MPPKAYTYSVSLTEYYEKYGVRRYGFHGTSHRYVAAPSATRLTRSRGGHEASSPAISATALPSPPSRMARCIDTIDGPDPARRPSDGHPLRRDRSLAGQRHDARSPSYNLNKMYRHSQQAVRPARHFRHIGSDMRDICTRPRKRAIERAKLAVDMLCYQIKKYIGFYCRRPRRHLTPSSLPAESARTTTTLRERVPAKASNSSASISTPPRTRAAAQEAVHHQGRLRASACGSSRPMRSFSSPAIRRRLWKTESTLPRTADVRGIFLRR